MELAACNVLLYSFDQYLCRTAQPFRWVIVPCKYSFELDVLRFDINLPVKIIIEWRPARKQDGCPYVEPPEQLAELKRYYLTPRDAVSYIMEPFPIVKRKDEEKWGKYRTQRVILEIYDAMQESIRTVNPYQTHLDPLPADPSCCHSKRERL